VSGSISVPRRRRRPRHEPDEQIRELLPQQRRVVELVELVQLDERLRQVRHAAQLPGRSGS
jgi:hypothetical protein